MTSGRFWIRITLTDAESDLVFHLNADSDPAFHFNADPDPAFHFNAGPDPDPDHHQSDANLQPLI